MPSQALRNGVRARRAFGKLLKRIKPRALARSIRRQSRALYRRATGQRIKGPRTLADNIRYFANPGPEFEKADRIDGRHLPSRAKTIAFYLPQFHAFAENDEWWGEGFTEWRNVARGTPRYRGHYQPRIPRDLGFYDLSSIDTIAKQCELAQHNGIDAFCFYYYWFNGQRLMEKPLDLFAGSKIDQQFCIMWANENWTRTWDGMQNDVLIQQDYLEEDEDAFLADTARYMADNRYVRVNGQPLFILYRPGLLPDTENTIARWRKKWHALLGEAPLIMMVQGFGQEDPRQFGMDGAVEFPPHKVCAGLNNINDKCHLLDENYQGLVRDYRDVVNKSISEPAPDFPLIKTVSPHWDNDARREGLGMTMHGSTPAWYEKWLNAAMDFATDNPINGESLVFINAWNEWAEGAYLEPDVHYGHAYLNATKRAAKGLSRQGDVNRILLVGHDAYQHGAQMLLLNIAKIYRNHFGMDVVIALKEGGPLVAEYQRVAKTVVLNKLGKNGLKKFLARHEFSTAICNTSVTGDLIPQLRLAGIRVVSLIHEMPTLIKDYKLESCVQTIAAKADHVVFPATTVKQGFEGFTDGIDAQVVIQPQGTYTPIVYDESARQHIRRSLGITEKQKVIIGVGYADLRKGFDLFMDTARRMVRSDTNVHFIWVGSLSGDMQRWIGTDFANQAGTERIHLIGFTDKVKDYYSAADCLFLPSREDPYPTVVLEAMNVGLPVLIYKGTTGFDRLLSTYGYVVELGDAFALDAKLELAISESSQTQRQARVDYVESHCQFDDYCFSLLELLHPELKRVSVVVPNYNYAQYLEQRLTSVFSQNYPVYEVILLDDGSTDASLVVAEQIAKKSGRSINVICSEFNSGSVFKQWHRAASLARGSLLWIAEADDSSDAKFVSTLANAMTPDSGMSFCDSKQIGLNGEHLSKSYQHYYSKAHPQLFSNDFTISGLEFMQQAMAVRNVIVNVSSVIWNSAKLRQSLTKIENELPQYDLVGDWLVYLELLQCSDVSVSYFAQALNIHRRHSTSVTHSIDARQHIKEIATVHRRIRHQLNVDAQTLLQMDAYIEEVSAHLGTPVSELDQAA